MKLVWLFVGLPLLCVGPLASAETAAYEPFAPLRVTKCEVAADLARPIRVLHVSDSHVTRVDSRDTEELRAFALSRSRMGRELGEHYLDEASALARQKGIPLVHTGDLVAFSGIACLEYAGRFLRTGDAVACVGNHEFWLSGERKNVESNRVECSARLAAAFPGHPVSVRRLEGLTLFVFDNASGLVSQEVADAFERVVAEGNPIALVCHVPLAAPDLEQIAWCSCGNETADERTRRFVERVRREPLVKAVLAGHVHAEHVGRFSPTAMEYVAGALFDGQAQEIEFRPASAPPATNAWPFAILRNYGSYERNRTFLSRVFAAQERHPGLVDEIWFAGCGDDPFGDPERMGAAAAGENLAARPVCERLGIRFSYQQGVTLNHEADDRPHSGIPDDAWVVDRAGKRRQGLFCCTSPFAIDFSYRKAKSIMAALKPDSYWPDDDLRILKVDWGRPGICFCPRCLDLFGRRVGRTYGRETLLAELDAGEKGRAATRRAWCDFNAEMLTAYAASFRRAADEVSPKTRLGIQACCSRYTATGDFYARVLRLFAGKGGRAGIRPGGGYYSDLASKASMLDKMLDIAREAARSDLLPTTGQICYEIENWPHIGAIKNPNAMMAECAEALAFGCDSIAFYWGADQNGESPESYDYWLETMHAWRPFHLAVRDAFRGSWLGGVAFCHGSDLMATADWFNLDDGCLTRLAQSGLPVTVMEARPDALFVNARAVESLAGGDLAKVFSGAVLTDPAGFAALQKKFPDLGFARKLEVRVLEGERALATDKRASGYERFARYGKCEKVRALLRPKADDVVRFSEMTADPKACGTCVIPTEFGGRVAVAQDLDGSWPHPCWPGCRRHAILDALDAAVPGGMPARILTDGYAVSVTVRKTPDGRTAGVLIMNLGGGETPPLELAVRRGAVKNWTVLRPKRESAPADVVRRDGTELVLRLPPLAAGEPVLVAPYPQ